MAQDKLRANIAAEALLVNYQDYHQNQMQEKQSCHQDEINQKGQPIKELQQQLQEMKKLQCKMAATFKEIIKINQHLEDISIEVSSTCKGADFISHALETPCGKRSKLLSLFPQP
jgi:hypothetical protein